MRSATPFQTLLLGLVTTATAAACGAASGGPGDLTDDQDGGGSAFGDGGRDGRGGDAGDARDAGGDVATIDCKPPPPEVRVVPMLAEYCYEEILADGGFAPDAGDRSATCQINCMQACAGISGPMGIGTCARLSATEVQCTRSFVCGRAPEGFGILSEARSLGELLAVYTALEAAAVDAFERLASELAAHRAPARLVDAAREAANDERRHARIMGALAHRHGGKPPPPSVSPQHVRPLFAVALENVVEGCVRETFGALLAFFQAEHAPDVALRHAMRGIAVDEARHAELSWQVAAWVLPLLSPAERAEIEAARASAHEALVQNSVLPVWEASGLPEPSVARALARSFAEQSASLAAAVA